MNGAGLNLSPRSNRTISQKAQEVKRVIKIGGTSILNNDSTVASDFSG